MTDKDLMKTNLKRIDKKLELILSKMDSEKLRNQVERDRMAETIKKLETEIQEIKCLKMMLFTLLKKLAKEETRLEVKDD